MEDLGQLISRINDEIRASGVNDITIKKALLNFVKAYNDIPMGDPAKAGEDAEALNLIEAVLGEDNPAIPAYIDFYNAAKRGEVTIEQ
jgi:uncharacterized protein (DUF2252 family)